MQQQWTLNIKDFGKIESASIEVAPLVLLVGENNSGKSYLMSLLWGVLALGRTLFPKEPPSTESYLRCSHLLTVAETVVVDEALQSALVEWFNTLLKTKRNDLARDVLSYKDVTVGDLSISNYRREKSLKIKWDSVSDQSSRISSGSNYVRFPVDDELEVSEGSKYRMIQYLCWNILMDKLSAPLFPQGFRGMVNNNRRAQGETLYFPAARSGFMLTYSALTAELMDSWGGGETLSKFTLPVVRFLQGLTESRQSKRAKCSEIADFLEQKILSGKVVSRERATINSYSYSPDKAKVNLPYHVASSLVGELSPLIIFLRSTISYKSLIIEEPEAHLHPEMQLLMVSALMRVVSKGIPVWLTTHSDVIFQQVNNMIKLNGHPEQAELMEKYGYEKEDLVDPEIVKAYQVVEGENGKAVVSAMERTENGFEVPTFNKALLDLSDQTLDFLR